MKARKLILSVVAAAMTFGMGRTVAATNEVSTLLQKGLFEEEANHNLDAAIKAYQAVVTQTEKDRQFAATAVFRLGECYRKQGNTNAAAVQYQRILREFADQPELAKLSREQLGPGASQAIGGIADRRLADELRAMSPEKRRVAVQQKFPNPVLNSLMEKMVTAEQELVTLKSSYGDKHPEVIGKAALLSQIQKQVDDQVDGVLEGLRAPGRVEAAPPQSPVSLDEMKQRQAAAAEQEEIRRLQVTIRDNPDLINAYNGENTPLLSAVRSQQVKVVKFLLDNKADMELRQKGGNGTPPLVWAAILENKEIVEAFLQHGANVNATDENRKTALYLAAERGYRSIAEPLLEHKAAVDARDKDGVTPLHEAARKGFKSIAELLAAHGADVNSRDNNRVTPLESAAAAGNRAIVEWLLANKADVNAANNDGWTSLTATIRFGKLEIARMLLEHGADIEAQRAGDHQRPLHLAVQYNWPDGIKLFLEHHADVNARCKDNSLNDLTPLILAANSKFDEAARLLIDAKADVNARDASGQTALLSATWRSDSALIKLLLDHHADPNIANTRSETPLFGAVQLNQPDTTAALLAHGADINASDINGQTPLHRAAMLNLTEMVDFLVAHGADVNAKDNSGKTPLDLTPSPVPAVRNPAFSRPSAIPNVQTPQLAYQWWNGNGNASPADGITNAASILRAHGGVSEMELSTIRVVRRGDSNVRIVARRDANSYNHYTLYEVIAYVYAPPSWNPQFSHSQIQGNEPPGLQFPDFGNLRIHRIEANGRTNTIKIDLDAAFAAGDCSKAMDLRWGDVVEIPESDHRVNELWLGLPNEVRDTLVKCLQRNVDILVKGQATRVTLLPRPPLFKKDNFQPSPGSDFGLYTFPSAPANAAPIQLYSFRLDDVVRRANVILSSSDLTRVKVKRPNPTTQKAEEMVFNLEKVAHDTDLWLRDGDVIELPEKGNE